MIQKETKNIHVKLPDNQMIISCILKLSISSLRHRWH